MPFRIGLRFYKIVVRAKGEKTNLPIGPNQSPVDLIDFVDSFVQKRSQAVTEEIDQRSWFFEPKPSTSLRTIDGLINYGTHGFESNFKDVKTKKTRFSRKSSDLEEIPLYFQFWSPDGDEFAFIAFQSFSARSCVNYVRVAMVEAFKAQYPNHVLVFSAMAPSKSMMNDAPVKTVTFYRPRSGSDRTDSFALGRKRDEIDYEVTVRARKRNSYLSTYGDLREKFNDDGTGFVVFEGNTFESVKADIKLGGRKRSVGVFGIGPDTGLIDVSDEVVNGPGGHPTLASIRSEVDELMESFYAALTV